MAALQATAPYSSVATALRNSNIALFRSVAFIPKYCNFSTFLNQYAVLDNMALLSNSPINLLRQFG
jgi:hypothetical protein